MLKLIINDLKSNPNKWTYKDDSLVNDDCGDYVIKFRTNKFRLFYELLSCLSFNINPLNKLINAIRMRVIYRDKIIPLGITSKYKLVKIIDHMWYEFIPIKTRDNIIDSEKKDKFIGKSLDNSPKENDKWGLMKHKIKLKVDFNKFKVNER